MTQADFWVIPVFFCLGLYCVAGGGNLIKVAIGLNIMESAVFLFFVALGYREGAVVPILGEGAAAVDPLPQAITLTAIVIGACTVAVTLALAVKLHGHYGTLDLRRMRGLRG